MSEKKFEECTLEESTHVELGGKVYEFGDGYLSRHKSLKSKLWDNIEVKKGTEGWQLIHVDTFPILGIKPLRERKRKPRECMALTVIAQRDGKDVVALLPTGDFELGMTVRCVEILEEEK
jgi:hypothetical protein